jgi:hypothetical protein
MLVMTDQNLFETLVKAGQTVNTRAGEDMSQAEHKLLSLFGRWAFFDRSGLFGRFGIFDRFGGSARCGWTGAYLTGTALADFAPTAGWPLRLVLLFDRFARFLTALPAF